jgi:GGDEF domain-containing protein
MAACNQRVSTQANTSSGLLPGGTLIERLQEEILRAQRHGTPLGMLLLRLDEHGEIRQTHGQRLSSEMFGYTGGTLTRQLRRFDRLGGLQQGELLALLPGADIVRSEVVARRTLARLRAIKVEIRHQRQVLPVHASIAQWTEGQTAELLIEQARRALAHEQLGFQDALRI